MAASKRTSQLWNFLLIFALVYLGSQLIFTYVFPSKDADQAAAMPIEISMKDNSIRMGANPVVVIKNNTDKPLTIPDRCPEPPVDIYYVEEGNNLRNMTSNKPVVLPCKTITTVDAQDSIEVDLGSWKNESFAKAGVYEIELPIQIPGAVTGSGAVAGGNENSQYRAGIITRFEITEPGFFTKTFRAFITKPLLNALIFVASLVPGHDLGLSIIILTLVIKLLLFIPTQHALEGQKKMQLLQPKFEAIRREHKDNPAKMQEETMKVWKENKVNPFQACAPLAVQFPVLIGLFYTVRDGSHLELSRHLIYPFYENIGWTFDTSFLGLDLTQSYVWLFPPLLVALQFIQMKLSFMIADKKKAKQIEKQTTKAVDTPQELQQQVMTYALPLMIGFFAIKFPSAVSLYWAISTLFAIGQQLIVNREHIKA